MTLKIEVLGWLGTALVVIAYVPQLRHLYFEKCAWGISISTWLIWLVAGALLLSYCIFRRQALLAFVQVSNIIAIMATIILARRSNQICPYHSASILAERIERKLTTIRRDCLDDAIETGSSDGIFLANQS